MFVCKLPDLTYIDQIEDLKVLPHQFRVLQLFEVLLFLYAGVNMSFDALESALLTSI